jgi:hypothetical protein
MRTIEQKIYSFTELSEAVQKKVISDNYEINVKYEWYELVYEDFIENNKYFEVDNIFFSGFWSQGDGAMFEYSSIKQELVDEFIDSLELSPMRRQWLENNICVSGKGKHRGHYYHENCCSHSIYWEVDNGDLDWTSNFYQWLESFAEDFEDFVVDRYRDLARDLYRTLEEEHDYLTSEDIIIESLVNYEFYEDGEIY